MARPKMTYEIAMAAARDAGNRNAREHGRTAWNAADYAVAVAEFDRLFPEDSNAFPEDSNAS